MQKVKVTVNFSVPTWHFCNDDRLDAGKITNRKCRFCVKTGGSYTCSLYDQSLYTDGSMIQKAHACKLACVGVATEVVEPDPGPTISPKELMEHTIEQYSKTVKELQRQGYPQPLAEKAAKQYILK